jgi:hypothetical protein
MSASGVHVTPNYAVSIGVEAIGDLGRPVLFLRFEGMLTLRLV